MNNIQQVDIDGEVLYIKGLDILGNEYIDDGFNPIKFAVNDLKVALKPIATLCKNLKEGMKELQPDETELTIQLSAGIDNGKLLFAVTNINAEAQLSVKYLWKKSN